MRGSTHFKTNARGTDSAYILDEYPDTGNLGFFADYFKLSSTYNGACVKVRRSSDDLELDIFFNGNYVDKQAILNHVGSGSGFVSVKYNQNGNGNNWTNTNKAQQPRIVNAGVLNEDVDGFVFEEYVNTSDLLNTNPFDINSFSAFSVFRTTQTFALFYSSFSSLYAGILQSGNTSTNPISNNVGNPSPTHYINAVGNISTRDDLYQAAANGNRNLMSFKSNSTNIISFPNGLRSTYTSTAIPALKNRYAECVYGIDVESDRVLIEALINQNYNIY